MGNIFGINSPLTKFMSKLVDLVVLNILWLVFSIPIVTIGASTAALYRSCDKLRKDDGKLLQNFWQAFRSSFRSATLFCIAMLIVGGAIIWNYYLLYTWSFSFKTVFLVLNICITVLYTIINSWYYPLLVNYDNTVVKTALNAVVLGISNPTSTMTIVILNLIPVALLLFKTDWFIRSIYFWTFVGIAAIAYLNSSVFQQVFIRLSKKAIERS